MSPFWIKLIDKLMFRPVLLVLVTLRKKGNHPVVFATVAPSIIPQSGAEVALVQVKMPIPGWEDSDDRRNGAEKAGHSRGILEEVKSMVFFCFFFVNTSEVAIQFYTVQSENLEYWSSERGGRRDLYNVEGGEGDGEEVQFWRRRQRHWIWTETGKEWRKRKATARCAQIFCALAIL